MGRGHGRQFTEGEGESAGRGLTAAEVLANYAGGPDAVPEPAAAALGDHDPVASDRGRPCASSKPSRPDDRAVTIRDRDSMTQERIPVGSLVEHLRDRL